MLRTTAKTYKVVEPGQENVENAEAEDKDGHDRGPNRHALVLASPTEPVRTPKSQISAHDTPLDFATATYQKKATARAGALMRSGLRRSSGGTILPPKAW
mgnify:FL=1|jgi:hypothetical protein